MCECKHCNNAGRTILHYEIEQMEANKKKKKNRQTTIFITKIKIAIGWMGFSCDRNKSKQNQFENMKIK